MQALLAGLFIAIGLFGVIFVLALFNTWVASILWTWFVTPAFGVLAPPLYIIYGLALFLQMFQYTPNNTGKSAGEVLVGGVMKSLIILILGWIVHGLFA